MKSLKCLALMLTAVFSTIAAAQYPDKPIRIVVPFAAAGVADILARIVAQKVGEQSGKTVVVENRTGAGGRIGYEAGAKSPPDGYTLVATDVTYTMMPALYNNLGWEHSDLAPVTMIGQMPFVVAVNANAKTTSMAELLATAKAHPNKINYGSSGIGSVNHIVTELFARTANIELTHVPYRGMGEAMAGLLGGSIDIVITAMPTAMNHIKSGKVVALGVTAPRRAGPLPNVPTTTESGVAFAASNWIGFTTPKGGPREAIDWVQKQVSTAISVADVRDRISATGAEAQVMTTEAFGKLMQDETRRWGEVIRTARIKAE
ncbi:MAG: Bug family tripartite tricarboxylate transporter substrate binding protein [Burkholderiales bacterium]